MEGSRTEGSESGSEDASEEGHLKRRTKSKMDRSSHTQKEKGITITEGGSTEEAGQGKVVEGKGKALEVREVRKKPEKVFLFKGDASGEGGMGGMTLEGEGVGGVEGDTTLEGGVDGIGEGGSTLEGIVQAEADVLATQTSMRGPLIDEPTTQS